jgi:transcriptional regulator GlxA family with amidase domain
VRFRVGAAGSALGVAARELRDRDVPLEELWGARAAGRLAVRLERAPTPAAAVAELAAAVVARLPPAGELDGLVRAAALRAAAPRTAVERLAFDLGLGERQLRRRFDGAVGYGPKTLQRVLRFQRFLVLARAAGPAPDLADLAFAAGYADQAHLTRECRRLSGLTPAAMLAAGAGPAGDPSVTLEPPAALAA